MSPEFDLTIDYVEFPATDVQRAKVFYSAVFGWKFEEYGPDYVAFNDGRLTGGFYTKPDAESGSPLVVIYAVDLEAVQQVVEANGGAVVKPTFSFPGGRRFHFKDPVGNVLAVWSDREPA